MFMSYICYFQALQWTPTLFLWFPWFFFCDIMTNSSRQILLQGVKFHKIINCEHIISSWVGGNLSQLFHRGIFNSQCININS